MTRRSGLAKRKGASAKFVSAALIAGGGLGLAACGSSPAGSSVSPPGSSGFESGFWVGTGSKIDQQLVYTAKLAYYLTALSLEPGAQDLFTPQEWQREVTTYSQLQAGDVVVKPGADVKDPAGVKPAAFTITQQPVIPKGSTTNQVVATVRICANVTAYAVFKGSGVRVPGLLGYSGPVLTTTHLVDSPNGGWLVNYSTGAEVSSCPPGHTP